jgi:hypothetical protein
MAQPSKQQQQHNLSNKSNEYNNINQIITSVSEDSSSVTASITAEEEAAGWSGRL